MAYEGIQPSIPQATPPATGGGAAPAPVSQNVTGYQGLGDSSASSGYQGITPVPVDKTAASASGAAFVQNNPPASASLPNPTDEKSYLETQAPIITANGKQLDTQGASITSLQKDIRTKADTYNTLQNKATSMQADIEKSAKNLQPFIDYGTASKDMVDAHNAKVEAYNKVLKDLNTSASDYKTSLDSFNAQASDYQGKIKKYNSDLTDYQTRAKAYDAEPHFAMPSVAVFTSKGNVLNNVTDEQIGTANPKNLKNTPLENPISSYLDTYKNTWNDTINKINAFSASFKQSNAVNIGAGLDAIGAVTNLIFYPISAVFEAADKTPIIGSATKAIESASSLITQTIKNGVGITMESLGASKETQDAVNEPIANIVSYVAQFLAGDMIAEKITPLIKEQLTDIKTTLTKNLIVDHTPGKSVYFDSAQIKDIWQTGKLLSESERNDVLKVIADDASRKNAFKNGVSIEIPARTLVSLEDKPYWSKIKSYFGFKTASEVISDTRSAEPNITTRGALPEPTVGQDTMNQHIQEAKKQSLGIETKSDQPTPTVPLSSEANLHIIGAKAEATLTMPADEAVGATTEPKVAENPTDEASKMTSPENLPSIVDEYIKQNGNEVNTDNARELFPSYRADRSLSSDVHSSASLVAREAYKKLLDTKQGTGNNTVLFTAGGTGVGKSKAVGSLVNIKDFPIIYDTNLSSPTSAAEKIDQALSKGFEVQIHFIYNDIYTAHENAMNRATNMEMQKGSGRTVPLKEHLNTHFGSPKSISILIDKYKGNNKVSFETINNEGNNVSIPRDSIDFKRNKVYDKTNEESIRTKLEEQTNKAHEEGRISDRTKKGILGNSIEKDKSADGAGIKKPIEKELINTQGGFINPSEILKDISDKAKEVKNLIEDTQHKIEVSADITYDLIKLEGANRADLEAVAKIAAKIKEIGINAEDTTALYHKAEEALNPTGPKTTLTFRQQTLADRFDQPLAKLNEALSRNIGKAGFNVPSDGYIQRFRKGLGNPLDKLLSPQDGQEARLSTGGLLTQSDASFKHRVMFSATDESGNRRVISIKKGKVTAFDDKQASSLGNFKTKTKGEFLETEIKPLQEKIGKIQSSISELESANSREPVSKAKLNAIGKEIDRLSAFVDKNVGDLSTKKLMQTVNVIRQKSAAYNALAEVKHANDNQILDRNEKLSELKSEIVSLNNEIASIENTYNPDELNHKVFKGSDDKLYTIGNATTKEIQTNTNLEYHENALASRLVQFLRLSKINRAIEFLETWKERPDFQDVAREITNRSNPAPVGWTTTKMPQFRGYVFEPRTAAALDDFYHDASGPKTLIDKTLGAVNRFLTTAIFYNPIAHPLNVTATWLVDQAGSLVNPTAYKDTFQSFAKAYTALATKNDDYMYALRKGAPIMSSSVNAKTVADGLFKMLSNELDSNTEINSTLAKAMGYLNPLEMKKALGKAWHYAAFVMNDLYTLQATYQRMARTGMTFEEATRDTARFIPDYRIPAVPFGSTSLKELTQSPLNPLFASSYHYGIIKSLANIAHDIVLPDGGQTTAEGNANRAGAVAKATMVGFLGVLFYKYLTNLSKKITGNPLSYVSAPGSVKTIVDLYKLATGQETGSQFAQSVLPITPFAKGAIELMFNMDLFTGNHIYGKPPADGLAPFTASLISPIDATNRLSPEDFALSFFNIHTPSTAPGKVALDQQVYDEKPALETEVKKDLVNGNKDDAQAKIDDFNQRVISNYNQALIQEGKVPLTQTQVPDILKQYGMKAPGVKAMANAEKVYADGTTSAKSSLINTVWNYAKAIGTDPATAFHDIFHGQIIRSVYNPLSHDEIIIVDRMPVGVSDPIRSARAKASGISAADLGSMNLDHVIPLEAGGTNEEQNLDLTPTTNNTGEDHTLENFLGASAKSGTISPDKVREFSIRYKAGTQGRTLSPAYMDDFVNKYGSKPITLQEVYDEVNGGNAK